MFVCFALMDTHPFDIITSFSPFRVATVPRVCISASTCIAQPDYEDVLFIVGRITR